MPDDSRKWRYTIASDLERDTYGVELYFGDEWVADVTAYEGERDRPIEIAFNHSSGNGVCEVPIEPFQDIVAFAKYAVAQHFNYPTISPDSPDRDGKFDLFERMRKLIVDLGAGMEQKSEELRTAFHTIETQQRQIEELNARIEAECKEEP